jgi:hypothetical protein
LAPLDKAAKRESSSRQLPTRLRLRVLEYSTWVSEYWKVPATQPHLWFSPDPLYFQTFEAEGNWKLHEVCEGLLPYICVPRYSYLSTRVTLEKFDRRSWADHQHTQSSLLYQVPVTVTNAVPRWWTPSFLLPVHPNIWILPMILCARKSSHFLVSSTWNVLWDLRLRLLDWPPLQRYGHICSHSKSLTRAMCWSSDGETSRRNQREPANDDDGGCHRSDIWRHVACFGVRLSNGWNMWGSSNFR